MSYQYHNGNWRHPERQAIFLGDFIDRGPKQVESVMIARRMVENGAAIAVLGNHELNAIAWFLPDSDRPGDFLRTHRGAKGTKNSRQHEAFIAEVASDKDLHCEIIDWFLTLPLWLELPGLRVIHACWHATYIEYLKPILLPDARLSRELMPSVVLESARESEKGFPEPSPFKATEALTKGIEVQLPSGFGFDDKDGHPRTQVRVRWWDAEATDIRRAAFVEDGMRATLPDSPVPPHVSLGYAGDKPVFFGHYWLTGNPGLLSPKVACLDYSVAKAGVLCAYRWSGETTLDPTHFCWVG